MNFKKSSKNNLKNNFKKVSIKIIQLIHLILVLYVVFGPYFFPNRISDIIVILFFILYRWITNDNTCTLTKIESKLTGNGNGFIYRIVNPIYQMRESRFNKLLYFITISWLIILIIIHKKNTFRN